MFEKQYPTPQEGPSGDSKEQGFVLIAALILVLLLLIFGAALLSMTDLEIQTSSNLRASTQAVHLGQAGLERAIGRLMRDPQWAASISGQGNAFSNNTTSTGTYAVEVFVDDPRPGEVRIRSTGVTSGPDPATATVEVVGVEEADGFPNAFDYAFFSCGNFHMQGNGDNIIRNGDAFVGGDFHMQGSGRHSIEGGDAFVLGNFDSEQNSRVLGNVFANGNADIRSNAAPAVGGDVIAGGSVTGGGFVMGSVSHHVTPLPVQDACAPQELTKSIFTNEEIDKFRSDATTVVDKDLDLDNQTLSMSGIVVVKGNLHLTGQIDLSDNVVFIVDGNVHLHGPGKIRSNPPGATITILVPTSDVHVQAGGDLTMDGTIQIGSINQDGTGLSGGNLHVQGGSNLEVNGTVGVFNGDMHTQGGSTFTLNYTGPTDHSLGIRMESDFRLLYWREIRK